jgi:opacity protein-like surface antigen
MRTLAAAAAALALLAPAAARPQPVSTYGGDGPDTYLDLHLGAFVPQSDDLDALDPGIAFAGTFGALFTRNLGVEGTLGYYRADGSVPGSMVTPDTDLTLHVLPMLVSLRFVAPLKVAELSARAGGGIHFASLSSGSGGFERSDSDTAFGFHVGASAAFNLSRTMLFGVDVLRTFVDADFDGADADLGGLLVSVMLGYKF